MNVIRLGVMDWVKPRSLLGFFQNVLDTLLY